MQIKTLLTGKPKKLENDNVISEINKKQTSEPKKVIFSGPVNNMQVDKKYHGGLDKAIYHYAFEHYQYWNSVPGISKPEVLYEAEFVKTHPTGDG